MFTTADIIAAVVAYLIGSLSFAVIVSRAHGLPDPHSYGSGNPGATNVLRSGSKKAAILTLLGDTLKGVAAVLLAKVFAAQFGITAVGIALVAITVFLGHLFPLFFGFKGGKGVATAAGVLWALDWRVGLGLTLIWALVFALTRVSSLSALIGSAMAPESRIRSSSVMWRRSSRRWMVMPSAPAAAAISAARSGQGCRPPRAFLMVAT